MNFGEWRNQCLAHGYSGSTPCLGSNWTLRASNDQKLPNQSLDDASNISIKRPNIAWNDKMRYKKDTKAKHVVSYTATRNLVKFLALNNLPVQCQRLLKLLLLLLLLVLPCSAAETTTLWLWTFLSLTNSWENWIFQNGNFYSWKHILFHSSSIGDIFGFMLTGGALQMCFIVVAPNHESYLYYSTSQYSVIHHMFFVQSCTRPIWVSLTIQISHH